MPGGFCHPWLSSVVSLIPWVRAALSCRGSSVALGIVVPLGASRHCVNKAMQDGEELRCDPSVVWGQPRAPSGTLWVASQRWWHPALLPGAASGPPCQILSGWFCLCTPNPAQSPELGQQLALGVNCCTAVAAPAMRAGLTWLPAHGLKINLCTEWE